MDQRSQRETSLDRVSQERTENDLVVLHEHLRLWVELPGHLAERVEGFGRAADAGAVLTPALLAGRPEAAAAAVQQGYPASLPKPAEALVGYRHSQVGMVRGPELRLRRRYLSQARAAALPATERPRS